MHDLSEFAIMHQTATRVEIGNVAARDGRAATAPVMMTRTSSVLSRSKTVSSSTAWARRAR
jgi:hypothetical protein